jgi:fructokinase
LFGCIEAGGTKFVCAVARGDGEVLDQVRIPTTDPAETLGRVIAWFGVRVGRCSAFGIASFGPADIDPHSATWGSILRTPKAGWSGTPIAGPIAAAFGVPIGFDTDVNAAALAEAHWTPSAAAGLAYVTVGTGIGGGLAVQGVAHHGARHPEMGHILPPRHPLDTDFGGVCPFHGACLEGLASGPAILARWGRPLSELPTDHPAHEIVGWYLGHLAATLLAMVSPVRIVFGGGVLATAGLIERIRAHAAAIAGDYLIDGSAIEDLITPPVLGDRSGMLGAMLLARSALGRVAAAA